MYSMILVDDEKIVLRGIRKVCEKENFDFEIIGAFSNPAEALDALPGLRPHLIITDIKMPQMDGLELSVRAKEILPDVEIVILSGYSDFTYAQTAVKIGVSDYLLKPIKKTDFAQTLSRIREKIQNRAGQSAYYRALQEYAQSSQTEVKNHFFLQLAEKGGTDPAYIHTFCEKMDLHPEEEESILIKFVITEFQMEEDFSSAIGKLTEEMKELLEPYGQAESFLTDEEVFVLVYGPGCASHRDDIVSIAESVLQSKRLRHLFLVAGVSQPFTGLRHMYAARNECDSQILIAQAGNTEEPFEKQNLDISIPYGDMEALTRAIVRNNREQMQECIDRIYNMPAHTLYRDYSYSLTFIIMLRLSHMIIRYGQGNQNISGEILNIRNLKHEYPRLAQQKALVERTAEKAAELTNGSDTYTSVRIVQEAVDYIQAHYNENISLADVSDHINISKSYLCDLFKKELNVTIINYITNLRMEKAKELLVSTDMKMYEISLQVGYNDYAYFSQIFKKLTGSTLSDYRRNH